MADQLYLSYEIRGFSAQNMLRHFERMVRMFPFSKLYRGGGNLRVNAVASTEPPVVEKTFEDPASQMDEIITLARESMAPDCAVFLESAWDIWQYDEDWKVSPARVTLCCFGPDFESEPAEDLRIEFGLDTHFLPQTDLPNNLFMSRSNVRSLLHLVHELDRTFPASTRRLWTESGENFAERLQSALESASD